MRYGEIARKIREETNRLNASSNRNSRFDLKRRSSGMSELWSIATREKRVTFKALLRRSE
jgi:hypothetical protein